MIIPEDNSCFQYFIENYRRYLSRHGFDPYYLWVRERDQAAHHHYHCYLLLNGNNIRNVRNVSKADELWSAACGLPGIVKGLIHICEFEVNGYIYNARMIHRDDRACVAECFEIIAYLAKVTTKGSASRYIREFACSRLPYDNFSL